MRRQAGLAIALAMVLSGCWAQFRGDAAHTGVQGLGAGISAANVSTLVPRWSATRGAITSSPAVVNGAVYVGSDDGKLAVFDGAGITNCSGAPATCTPRWTGATGGAVRSSPAVSGDFVTVGSDDGKVYAFDANGTVGCGGTPVTCTPRWTGTTGGPVGSSPTIANGVVSVGSDDGTVYALDLATGAVEWTATTGGAVRSSPAVANGTLVVGSDDGKVYAYDATGTTNCGGSPTSCTPLWTATLGGPVGSSPAIVDGRVIVGSDDGTLDAFDAAGTTSCGGTPKICTPLWTATTGGPVRSSPAVSGGTAIVGSDDGKVYAFDATTGARRWTATTGDAVRSSPAVVNGTAIVGSDDGKVYAFDAAGTTNCSGSPRTCSPLWATATGSAVRSSPAVVGDAVHVPSQDGVVHTYGLTGAAPTTTTLTSSANPSAAGSAVTFTATVASNTGTPAGSVVFADTGTTIGSAPLIGGIATFTTSALTVGTHPVTARYTGNAANTPSTSSTLTQTVATGRFVDRGNGSCTDSGNGTPGAPFCTINAAAQKATAGQTVTVAAGTYPETVTVGASGTSTAPITFTSAPGATVTVTGGTYGFTMTSRSWIVIRGFTITNTSSYGIRVTGSDHVTLDRNHVSGAGEPVSGQTEFGIGVNSTTQSVLTGNVTDHNSDAGISVAANSNSNVVVGNESFANARGYVRAAAGIDVRNSTGNLVTANRTHDNEDSGINAWTGTANGSNTFSGNVAYRNGDHGIDVHNAVDARVVSNTVFGNVDSGIESTTSTYTHIANNISVDNGIDSPRTSGQIRIDSASAPTATLAGDLVWMRVSGVMIDWSGTQYGSLAAFRNATGQETRGLEADPRFRSSGTGDLHLLAGSPAIDSADSGAAGQPGTDADGLTRFDDPATVNTGIGPVGYADRGAYEFRG